MDRRSGRTHGVVRISGTRLQPSGNRPATAPAHDTPHDDAIAGGPAACARAGARVATSPGEATAVSATQLGSGLATGSHSVFAGALAFETVRGCAGLDSILGEWRRLEGSFANASFCNRSGWFRAYLHGLAAAPDEILFVVARRSGELVLVLPLHAKIRSVAGLKFRILASVIDPHLRLADALIDPRMDAVELMGSMVRWLREQRAVAWDMLNMSMVPASSPAIQGLIGAEPDLTLNGYRFTTLIDCDGPYEDTTRAISGAFKRNLRRLARRAEASDGLEFQSFREYADLPDALARFLEVEASGWKGERGLHSAIKYHAATVDFYQQLVEEFGRDGRCVINLVRYGARDAAGQLCLFVDGVLYILKIGYDEQFASISPGNLLLEHTLRACCADPNVRALSFVTDPTWSHHWRPRLIGLAEVELAGATWRGRLFHGLKRLGRRWLTRRRVPQD
jgi:CelD/BcsL family acetyltransferase involved in cellulose biosynthesis